MQVLYTVNAGITRWILWAVALQIWLLAGYIVVTVRFGLRYSQIQTILIRSGSLEWRIRSPPPHPAEASEIYWGGCLEACQRASRWQSCLLELDSAGIAGLCSCITACDAAGRPQARLLASLGSELEKVLRC
ncbi:unnamed protein product [Effrenium voratum]|nr:unnamed protein product [Effrenium voratum]